MSIVTSIFGRSVGSIYHDIFPFSLRAKTWQLLQHQHHRSLKEQQSREGAGSLAPFDRHQCIFVHVPKAAGTSIGRSLFGQDLGGKHTKLSGYEVFYGQEVFQKYFKFAFVRNPWDRLVSSYEFLRQGGMTPFDKEWAETNLAIYPDFRSFVIDWLSLNNIYRHPVFTPQWEFLMIKGKIPLDFLGRYETLNSDFSIIAKKLQLHCSLEHHNRTKSRQDYQKYYDPITKNIVASVYRKDIENFDYSF